MNAYKGFMENLFGEPNKIGPGEDQDPIVLLGDLLSFS